MHSSRMRTACFNGHVYRGCLLRGVSAWGVSPQGCVHPLQDPEADTLPQDLEADTPPREQNDKQV